MFDDNLLKCNLMYLKNKRLNFMKLKVFKYIPKVNLYSLMLNINTNLIRINALNSLIAIDQ